MRFKIIALICILIFPMCSTLSKNTETETEITERGPFFEEGKGRSDMTLAILRPEGIDLADDEEKYLDIIQGALNNDFNRFSEIKLFDSKNLEEILKQQQLTLSGNYSESDYIRIGELSQSNYILTGSLTKITTQTVNMFTLDLSLTELETGLSQASFNKTVRLREIVHSSVSRAAAAEILPQLGVVFTAEGIAALNTELSAEETEAQNSLALSYEASRSGHLIDALIYSSFASSSDVNSAAARKQAEDVYRLMGGAGAAIIEDIKRQAYWKENLTAFEDFFRRHPPFELFYTSVPVQKGTPDYDRGTVDFEFNIGLRYKSIGTMQNVLNDILKELKKTDYKKNQWGFDRWPRISARSSRTNQIQTDLFTGYMTFNIRVALLNKDDEIIETINFPLYGQLLLQQGNNIRAFSNQERQMLITVPSFKITEGMHFQVLSINGIDADKSNIDAYLRNAVVQRMPLRNMATISKNQRLTPELPEERDKRLAQEQKKNIARANTIKTEQERKTEKEKRQRTRAASWNDKALKNRISLSVGTLYNPVQSASEGTKPEDAFAIDAIVGFGIRNFSFSGRLLYPMDYVMARSSDNIDHLMYGVGFGAGYTYVWQRFLLGIEAGMMYYKDRNDDAFAFLPTIEAKFEMIPRGSGFGFRVSYLFEFGSPNNGTLYNYLFRDANSFGSKTGRVIGRPALGIGIWF